MDYQNRTLFGLVGQDVTNEIFSLAYHSQFDDVMSQLTQQYSIVKRSLNAFAITGHNRLVLVVPSYLYFNYLHGCKYCDPNGFAMTNYPSLEIERFLSNCGWGEMWRSPPNRFSHQFRLMYHNMTGKRFCVPPGQIFIGWRLFGSNVSLYFVDKIYPKPPPVPNPVRFINQDFVQSDSLYCE
jgi:hypothetical protein